MRPSRSEAAVYQRMHGHRDIVVELSGWSPFDPVNARLLDARAFASFAEAPDGVRFEPDTLATADGLLRLSETALYIDRLAITSRDDRMMSAPSNLRFSLPRDPDLIARQVSTGILPLLARELPSRVMAAVRAEVSRLRYDTLQAEFQEIEQRVLQRLRKEIGLPPDGSNGQLGLVLSSLTIELFEDHFSRTDAPYNLASSIAQTAGAIEAIQGAATMNEIAPIIIAQHSLEQTRAVARAPNGFMIAPQHLGGFDPVAGAYSPMMNPAISYLNREINRSPVAAPSPDNVVKANASQPESQVVNFVRPGQRPLRPAQTPSAKRDDREFDSDRQRFKGPI